MVAKFLDLNKSWSCLYGEKKNHENIDMDVAMGEWGPHSHKHKLNMADFILHMPPRFFARVFGNPAGDPVLLKSRGVTLLRDNVWPVHDCTREQSGSTFFSLASVKKDCWDPESLLPW